MLDIFTIALGAVGAHALVLSALFLIFAVVAFALRPSAFYAPVWVFLASPAILHLLVVLTVLPGLLASGPSGGFLAMGSGLTLLMTLPVTVLAILIVWAFPRRQQWVETSLGGCALAVLFSAAFCGLTYREMTVPAKSGASAIALVDRIIQEDASNSAWLDPRYEAFTNLVKDPATDPKVLAEVGRKLGTGSRIDPTTWMYLAHNPSFPDEVVRDRLQDPLIAGVIACNSSHSDLLLILAASPNANVRACLTKNPATSVDLLKKLLNDTDSYVRESAQWALKRKGVQITTK